MTSATPAPRYEKPVDAAARLSVSVRTLRRAVDDGRLTAYRLSPQADIRYRTDELDKLMASTTA